MATIKKNGARTFLADSRIGFKGASLNAEAGGLILSFNVLNIAKNERYVVAMPQAEWEQLARDISAVVEKWEGGEAE